MPIRPENVARYPANWKQIVELVRVRSGDRCEGSPDFPSCRVANGAVGYREEGEWHQLGKSLDEAAEYIVAGFRVVRVVLTVGHLDHVPEHCDLSNLRHWCQRCHLNYDKAHHALTAYRTRREGRVVADLFGGVDA